jgi:hypothetical protein
MDILCALGLATCLCVNGHPAPRSQHVTYGHVHCPSGFVRDHKTPLCGGGLDTADNIQCQELEESYVKDGEERKWCEDMCRSSNPERAEKMLQFHFQEKWGGKP